MYNKVIFLLLHQTSLNTFCPSIKLISSLEVLDSFIIAFALLTIVCEHVGNNKHVHKVSLIYFLGEGDDSKPYWDYFKLKDRY